LKAEQRSPDYIANVATSLWLSGHTDLAVLIQGREAAADPANLNSLNNYAAFLTMSGGEHAAIPILQSLDARIPDNSTILNNLGQAWFGLGEINRAEEYLDRALAAYPRHAQANLTKSRIQEAQGKTSEAIQSVKRAMEEHWTADKEHRVTDLGGTVEFEDIPFPYPRPRGPWPPLGVEKFWNAIPPYPFTAADADINARRWQEFREEVAAASQRLQPEMDAAKRRYDAAQGRIMADPRLLLPYNNPIHNTAHAKRVALAGWAQGRLLQLAERTRAIDLQVEGWRRDMALGPNASCEAHAKAAETFLQKANGAYRDLNTAMVDYLQQFTGGPLVTLNMYAANDPAEYEWLLATQKSEILTFLRQMPMVWAPICGSPQRETGRLQPLPDFDEANCDHQDEIFIPPFTTIRTECNRMSTAFDINTEMGAKVRLGWEENLNTGTLTRGTLELGYEAGLTPANLKHLGGPFSGEMKVEGAVGIEVTPDGVKEVYVKAKASSKMTGHVTDAAVKPKSSITGSLEVRSSWNAGSGGSGSSVGVSGRAAFSAMSWSTR
jgi:tetratricopeptide (TPR) repeat protein